VEIKLHDKVKALELLAKHLGIFDNDDTDSQGVTVVINGEAQAWSE
jgi:hypothetical protein